MVVVKIKHPHEDKPEVREFYFKNSAVTWLLLSGFFPTDSEQTYRNIFTESLAELEHKA